MSENFKETIEKTNVAEVNSLLQQGWKFIGFYVFKHEEQEQDDPSRWFVKEEPRYVLGKE